MILTAIVIAKAVGAALIGVLAGILAVDFFNKMPPRWLTEYGEEPSDEVLDRSKPRLKRNPWAYLFAAALAVVYIKFIGFDFRFFMGGAIAVWCLLEMSIADIRYKIVPDQLIVLLAATGFGFIPFLGSWKESLLGALGGVLIMTFMVFLGKLIFKKAGVGGGDVKIFAALGLITGLNGIILIFLITTALSSLHIIYLLTKRKIKAGDSVAMVPYITLATVIYMGWLWNLADTLIL